MDEVAGQETCDTILNSTPAQIVAANRKGVILLTNRDAFGFSREEIIGKSIYDFMHEDFLQTLRNSVDFVFERKAPTEFVFKEISEDEEKWFRMRMGPAFVGEEVEMVVLTSNDITEQKNAEERLQDSETKLRNLFDITLEGVILTDEVGNIIEWNRAQEDMFGKKRNEVIGEKVWDIQYEFLLEEERTRERYDDIRDSFLNYFSTGKAPWLGEIMESEIQLGSGENAIIQQFSSTIETSKGFSLAVFIHDITARIVAEKERAASEKRYRSLFEENNDAIIILDLDGIHIDFNKRAEELLGYAREELVGQSIEVTVSHDDYDESQQKLRELLEGKQFPIYERTLIRKDGTEVPVEVNISLIRDEENNPLHLQSILRDISARKAAAIALSESEERYRTLVENMQDGIVIIQEGKIIFTNRALAAIIGYSVDELQGKNMIDLIAPVDKELVANRYRRRLAGENIPSEYEVRALHRNGELVFLRIKGDIIEFQGKTSTIATISDITQQKNTEIAVRKERDRAEMYLEMAGVIFLALDIEGRITLLNRKGAEVLGYRQEEALSKSWFDFIREEDRVTVREKFEELINGKVTRLENQERYVVTKSGEERLISWNTTCLKDSNGNTLGTISSGEDITEKRAAQIELKASREMLQIVMNNIPQHIFWKDTESVYLGCNDSFAQSYIAGTPEDVVGKTDYDLGINPQEADAYREADKKALEGRYEAIESAILPTGNQVWFRTVKVPLQDGLGNAIGILGALEDVTEKRRAEMELIESETKVRTLLKSISDLVFVFDEDDLYTEYYAQDDEELYVPPEEFLGRHIMEVLPLELAQSFVHCMHQVRKTGKSETFDYLLPDKIRNRWFSARLSLHDDKKSVVAVIRETTEKVLAQKEVEQAYNIVNMSPAVVFLWRNEENWPVEYVSRNVADLFGYSAEELQSGLAAYSQIVHPEDLDRVTAEVAGFSADALCESFRHEPYRIVRKDGEVRWITDDTVIRRNEKGNITHYQGVVSDITERIHVLNALRDSEAKYRTVIEQSLMGLAIIDINERTVLLANPLIAHYIGKTPEELRSMTIKDLIQIIHPDDLDSATRFIDDYICGKDPGETIVRIVRNDKVTWILIDGSSVVYEGRNAIQLSIVEITERMKALETLEMERASFRSIAESAIHAETTSEMGRLILEGVISALKVDSGTLRLYNERENVLHPTALVGLPYEDSRFDAPCTEEGKKEFLVSKVALSKEPMIISDSSTDSRVEEYRESIDCLKLASFVAYPLLNDRKKLLGTFTIASTEFGRISEEDREFFDTVAELLSAVVERKLTEQAYQMSVRRYRDLLTNMAEGIGVISLDEKFIFVNESLANIVGFTTNDLIGSSSTAIIHPEDVPKIRAETEYRRQGKSSTYQVRMITKSGDTRIVRISAIPSRDDDGRIEGTVAIVTDITEGVRAEQEVMLLNEQLAQRVEERTAELEAANKELEAFAYSVSHDLRAPLRSIDGFSQAVLEDYADSVDETGRDYLNRIRSGAMNMGRLIEDVLSLSRVTRADMERIEVNLSRLAEEAVTELKEAEPERNVQAIIGTPITARCDKRLMRIVLQNLIGNAWKFTSMNDDATIELGVRDIDGELVYFVKDDGVGFDMEQKEKLFKPFQRLHKADEFEGSGIGLATVQRVITRHGGRIWAESQPNEGTIFYFTLATTKEEDEYE